MNTYIFEYEEYLSGLTRTMRVEAANEREARRIFDSEHPLSDVTSLEIHEY